MVGTSNLGSWNGHWPKDMMDMDGYGITQDVDVPWFSSGKQDSCNVTSDFLGCWWRDLSKNNIGVQLYTETSGTETNQETTMMLVACDQAGISKILIYLGHHHQRRWKTYINPSTINLPSTSYPPSVWPPKWENLKTKCHPQSKQLSFPWCCWWNLTVLTSSAHLYMYIYICVYIYIHMCVYIYI